MDSCKRKKNDGLYKKNVHTKYFAKAYKMLFSKQNVSMRDLFKKKKKRKYESKT